MKLDLHGLVRLARPAQPIWQQMQSLLVKLCFSGLGSARQNQHSKDLLGLEQGHDPICRQAKDHVLLPCDMRSCTNAGASCMTSACTENRSILILLQNILQLVIFSPLQFCFFFCHTSCSSSSSYFCEQSQFCLKICPIVLCAVYLASSCTLAFSDACNNFLSHFILFTCCHLPPVFVHLSMAVLPGTM